MLTGCQITANLLKVIAIGQLTAKRLRNADFVRYHSKRAVYQWQLPMLVLLIFYFPMYMPHK